MSSSGKSNICRICGGALMGNQRRWLFGGQNKKNGHPQTPTEPTRQHNLSSQNSPWGSTLSLGSAGSLSKSQLSLSSSSKGVDLLSVLTHILGQSVPRGGELGEFVCGKCVCILERVFRFDSVIARVRVLSSERLQKLTQERNKIRQWVCKSYRQRHLQDFQSWGSTSEEDGEWDKEGYRDMLKENMALSEYECWSERWDACPYFIKTGKRCRKGKGCEGCDVLRVSDSDYEAVCGVPRHLPFQPSSPFGLTRDKSQSMPLHWQGEPSISSSPRSLAGSTPSLHGSLHSESIHSLDSPDGHDPFDSPGVFPANFVLKELKRIEGKMVRSPAGSRIPVLRRNNGSYSEKAEEAASPSVNKALSFGTLENGDIGMDGEVRDVLTDLRDEFLPLHQENRVRRTLSHLRGQLDKARSPAGTPGAGPDQGWSRQCEVDGSAPTCDSFLLLSLGHSLHSRERVIQECLGLIRRVCVEDGTGTELTNKLTEHLKEILADNKTALEALRSKMTATETNMEKEISSLRKAGRDREQDLETLNSVLQCNQDLINDLRVALGEKEQKLKEVEKEVELWRQKDRALTTVLQEKEAQISLLQTALRETVQESPELADLFELREESGASLCQEVTKLTTDLQEYQLMVQHQQESHSQTVTALAAELRDMRLELRKREKERRESERVWLNSREDWKTEEEKLMHNLQRRDRLIQQILLDAEERDHLLTALQQKL
ncbi:uncharacterized protein isoform X1 [Takifugu rubripes]|uniref:uncharacterized protein isoform X1 n=1 Tax=Takifugu rubripes TaxID=31033 RepID=UPI00114524D8|nr:uncharacterized protein LOC105416618 isoform X1 [Takifugu rubripes]